METTQTHETVEQGREASTQVTQMRLRTREKRLLAQDELSVAQDSLEIARRHHHIELEGYEADRAQEMERRRPTGITAWLPTYMTGLTVPEPGPMSLRRDAALLQWKALEPLLEEAVRAARYTCVLACLEMEREAAVNAMAAAGVATAIAAAARDEAERKERLRLAAARERAREAENIRIKRAKQRQERSEISLIGRRKPGAKPEQRSHLKSTTSTSRNNMYDVCRRIGGGLDSIAPAIYVMFAEVLPASVLCNVVNIICNKRILFIESYTSSIASPVLLVSTLCQVHTQMLQVWRAGACHIDSMCRLGYG